MTSTRRPEAAIEPVDRANGRPVAPPIDRLTYRFSDVAAALGVSRRLLERELSARRFPQPDLHIGRVPLWRVETVRGWLERGGR